MRSVRTTAVCCCLLFASWSANAITEQKVPFVDEEISSRPIRIFLPTASFEVPRNYLGPKNANDPDSTQSDSFGFYMFLPHYEGFTPATAKYFGNFTPVRNDLVEVRTVVVDPPRWLDQGGKKIEMRPRSWGDAEDQFNAARRSGYVLIAEHDGLKCYASQSAAQATRAGQQAVCLGVRANGEKVFMRTNVPPEEDFLPFQCNVRYFSQSHRTLVHYVYSRRHIDRWREIDEIVWKKLEAWRVK